MYYKLVKLLSLDNKVQPILENCSINEGWFEYTSTTNQIRFYDEQLKDLNCVLKCKDFIRLMLISPNKSKTFVQTDSILEIGYGNVTSRLPRLQNNEYLTTSYKLPLGFTDKQQLPANLLVNMKKVDNNVGIDASRQWSLCYHFIGDSVYASNNISVGQYFLGNLCLQHDISILATSMVAVMAHGEFSEIEYYEKYVIFRDNTLSIRCPLIVGVPKLVGVFKDFDVNQIMPIPQTLHNDLKTLSLYGDSISVLITDNKLTLDHEMHTMCLDYTFVPNNRFNLQHLIKNMDSMEYYQLLNNKIIFTSDNKRVLLVGMTL